MRKRLLTTLAFIAVTSLAIAQQASAPQKAIQFEAPTHDFGTLTEEQGSAAYTFTFTNNGSVPLKLVDVKPSCGCTAPEWSKEAVAPGASGTITAVYTTTNRPGKFEKFITVRALPEGATQEEIVVLTIRGDVTPRVKTVADYFPHQDGSLRFSTNHVAFGTVYAGTEQELQLKIYNDSGIPQVITKLVTPPHISLMVQEGIAIAPNDSLVIPVVYDSKAVDDWGFIHHLVVLQTNDPVEEGKKAQKRIYVSADIKENFGALSEEEKASAPVAVFNTKEHDFGKIAANARVTTEFTITNTGKRPLIIRKTKASCGCTATQPGKTVLAPGESTSMRVTFDSTGKTGKQQKSITVITNDPQSPQTILYIKGDIQTPEAGG